MSTLKSSFPDGSKVPLPRKAVVFAHIHARRRDGSVFIWQKSEPVVRDKTSGWVWYRLGKDGAKVFVKLQRKRDGRFFLYGHAAENTEPAHWR